MESPVEELLGWCDSAENSAGKIGGHCPSIAVALMEHVMCGVSLQRAIALIWQ